METIPPTRRIDYSSQKKMPRPTSFQQRIRGAGTDRFWCRRFLAIDFKSNTLI
jgi:hypothetical protein